MQHRIAIIGAGITGLTAAYRLSSAGCSVALYEEAGYPGGLVSSFQSGNEMLESFYHHIFTGDVFLLDLCSELGIDGNIRWFEPQNAIFVDDRLYPFTSPADLLRFTPLPFLSRIRTGMLALTSSLIRDYAPYEKVTARDWLLKRAGKASYDKIWGPLLVSKFDNDADSISGTWIWNKLKLRGTSRDKNLGKEQLGYMGGGFSLLVTRLTEKIRENGGVFHYNCKATDIEQLSDGKFTLNGSDESYDKVLFTASPRILSEMKSPIPPEYRERLSALKMKSNICMVLELEESLSPYYWTTVAQRDIPFVLAIEHTRLVGMRDYKSHIVYLSRYIDAQDPLFESSDASVEEIFLKGLEKVFPGFKRAGIKRVVLSRALDAQPVITKGYSKLVPSVKTPVRGLYLASMPQIYPEDRGMNYAVRLGIKASDEITGSAGGKAAES